MIADVGDGFQEHLGQEHGRSDIEENAAAMEAADQLGQAEEIPQRCPADGLSGSPGMEMDDVRADGDVDGDGNLAGMTRRPYARNSLC